MREEENADRRADRERQQEFVRERFRTPHVMRVPVPAAYLFRMIPSRNPFGSVAREIASR
jgi:hypothetical protein